MIDGYGGTLDVSTGLIRPSNPDAARSRLATEELSLSSSGCLERDSLHYLGGLFPLMRRKYGLRECSAASALLSEDGFSLESRMSHVPTLPRLRERSRACEDK